MNPRAPVLHDILQRPSLARTRVWHHPRGGHTLVLSRTWHRHKSTVRRAKPRQPTHPPVGSPLLPRYHRPRTPRRIRGLRHYLAHPSPLIARRYSLSTSRPHASERSSSHRQPRLKRLPRRSSGFGAKSSWPTSNRHRSPIPPIPMTPRPEFLPLESSWGCTGKGRKLAPAPWAIGYFGTVSGLGKFPDRNSIVYTPSDSWK